MAESTTSESIPAEAAAATTSREPVCLPTYKLGDEGKPNHFAASTSRESAAIEARALATGDAAFIKRSDLKWTYAIVTELVEPSDSNPATILRFEVDKERNRKSFPEAQWGKYIRVIKIGDEELAKMKEEAAAAKEAAAEEEALAAEEVGPETEEEPTAAAAAAAAESVAPTAAGTSAGPETAAMSSAASVGGESAKSNKSGKSKSGKSTASSSAFSGFFGGLFGSSASRKTEEAAPPAAVPEEEPEEEESAVAAASEAPVTEAPAAAGADAEPAAVDIAEREYEAPIDAHTAEPMTEDPAAAALAATSFPKPAQSMEESVKSARTPSVVSAAAKTLSVVPTVAATSVGPATEAPTAVEAPAAPAAAAESTAPSSPPPAPPAAEPDNTKENSDPSVVKLVPPSTFIPHPKSAGASGAASTASGGSSKFKDETGSAVRTPMKLKTTLTMKKKNSLVNKLFNKKKGDKESSPKPEEKKTVTVQPATVTAPPAASSPAPKVQEKKEWFDPEASEVDYDKNPTDLFQALEARQFTYAEEMYKQVNRQFTKECKTWVVARGQKKKDSQLRFRALPLHAALVFGAPDDMILKILNAYPKATRGRDVKGRLPIHLAMEHNASERVVADVLEAFPKGFFAKDKKDMVPLDYVNGNMDRAYMKRYVPLLTAAKVADEHTKWETEKEEALAAQRIALKNDPVYMEDVVERVTDEIENTYATKMELLEANYQKEIQLLKKKHDSETQALLEGFEVKLNFERKLNKLKTRS
eukprot:CAMPEP_0172530488 /NCGR_PEP_ID=MMETSP1067-20121228/4205_1 /TAXON_ID=265564 ORGANISM="Thalassiosira punctigera, Strain Tpunct2005C2" /NCGR_SAMPLE_ID=MMETSP1067 /ASSEMBLY_ACC=CAM_ASM_000444 /LENGTH=758 /DNA_ID=CAMNT_0013314707 /DNA_START=243 /DNA_END=2519 /DNA_ORIENTATION=+